MSVKYTIDDFSTTKNYTVVGTQFYKDRVGSVGHTVLFASDVLPAGQHTLSFDLVTISSDADSNDFSLSFDYIIYSPSVNSLAVLRLLSLRPALDIRERLLKSLGVQLVVLSS